MKKLIIIALAFVSMIEMPARAQIDYLGNHLETVQQNNLRRHQQEMASGKRRSSKRKIDKRSYRSNRTRSSKSSTRLRKEENVSASRLKVGDAISAIRFGKNNLVFKTDPARVSSRSPLTLNLRGSTVGRPLPRGNKSQWGDLGTVTSTGRRSGVIGIMTLKNPSALKFTRVNR